MVLAPALWGVTHEISRDVEVFTLQRARKRHQANDKTESVTLK